MKKKQRYFVKKVLFNASVVLAGLRSPNGGSGKLLKWATQGKISAMVSEVILDEVKRNLSKLKITSKSSSKIVFDKVLPPPQKESVRTYEKVAVDVGDAHVLASAKEAGADFLVSLDKKHILVLKDKIKKIKIVSPKELIEKFDK